MSAVLTIDKYEVKQSFSSAAKTYDNLAVLQREVGLDLIDKFALTVIKKNVEQTVIDIGCGTGFLTKYLIANKAAVNVIALDIALSMLQVSREKLVQSDRLSYICADAESLPLQSMSVDQIYSNLALQWCQNLSHVFKGFYNVLKPEGGLTFSTFGPQTLKELKASWAAVDSYMHVNEFYAADQIRCLLEAEGFKKITIESKFYQSQYPSVLALMRELKGIGAHNVLAGRNKSTTSKTAMNNMIKAYEKYRQNQLITATYEIIFVKAVAGR